MYMSSSWREAPAPCSQRWVSLRLDQGATHMSIGALLLLLGQGAKLTSRTMCVWPLKTRNSSPSSSAPKTRTVRSMHAAAKHAESGEKSTALTKPPPRNTFTQTPLAKPCDGQMRPHPTKPRIILHRRRSMAQTGLGSERGHPDIDREPPCQGGGAEGACAPSYTLVPVTGPMGGHCRTPCLQSILQQRSLGHKANADKRAQYQPDRSLAGPASSANNEGGGRAWNVAVWSYTSDKLAPEKRSRSGGDVRKSCSPKNSLPHWQSASSEAAEKLANQHCQNDFGATSKHNRPM